MSETPKTSSTPDGVAGGTHLRADVLAEEYRGRYLWDELDKAKARIAALEEQLGVARKTASDMGKAYHAVRDERTGLQEQFDSLRAAAMHVVAREAQARELVGVLTEPRLYAAIATLEGACGSNPATRPDYPCDCGPDEYCSSDQCHGAVPDPASERDHE